MTPKELKENWNLSYARLALFLCRDQRTVERYCNGAEVPEMVYGYCWFLNQWFLLHGVTPPPFIFTPAI
ncbi:hypothetical protein [Nostoc sphaeroides]|jgi:hypothetical protein|uniref:XRE family transcriptional regulator n=1 Tax=Nostoc sphaeroides CCNUC1 TaxID=2653204 RepID=A0A5P8WF87_9NOSO|nr:hypothetical protein [Nostoc sphaeroides]QFS50846.1 hypothetical protein GXM_08340 [Nostoc sphaeroides CCNUC1]